MEPKNHPDIPLRVALGILGLSTILFIGLNCVWIYLNQRLPFDDTAGHTVLTFLYTNLWNGTLNFPSLTELYRVSIYYPPFIFLISSLLPLLFGFSYKLLQFWSQGMLLGTVLAVFFYTRQITKQNSWAVITALCFLLIPQVWEQSRIFMLDIPLTGLIMASLFALEKSEGLNRPRWVIAAFLLAGFAQLTKWYAPLYLFIPVSVTLVAWYRKNRRIRPAWISMGIGIASFLVLVLPWYLINMSSIIGNANVSFRPDFGDPTALWSLGNFLYYAILSINYQLTLPLFLWFIICLFFFIKHHAQSWKGTVIHLASIYVIFSLIPNKDIRYLLPLLPFVAFVMGYGNVLLINTLKRKGLLLNSFIVGALMGFFIVSSFGIPITVHDTVAVRLPLPYYQLILFDASSRYVPYLYTSTQWSPEPIVTDLSYKEKEPTILLVSNTPALSVATMEVFSMAIQPLLHFRQVPDDRVTTLQDLTLESYLQQFNYLLVPKQDVGLEAKVNYKNMQAIREYIVGGRTRNFFLLNTYQMPGEDLLYLLANDPGKNILTGIITSDRLTVTRPPAVARIYYQLEKNDGKWIQDYIREEQTTVHLPLSDIQTIRIDYPSSLLSVQGSGWHYDGINQLDRE